MIKSKNILFQRIVKKKSSNPIFIVASQKGKYLSCSAGSKASAKINLNKGRLI